MGVPGAHLRFFRRRDRRRASGRSQMRPQINLPPCLRCYHRRCPNLAALSVAQTGGLIWQPEGSSDARSRRSAARRLEGPSSDANTACCPCWPPYETILLPRLGPCRRSHLAPWSRRAACPASRLHYPGSYTGVHSPKPSLAWTWGMINLDMAGAVLFLLTTPSSPVAIYPI